MRMPNDLDGATRIKYRTESWIDPRIEIRNSLIEGKGLFAKAPVQKDETLIICGGTLFVGQDIETGRAREQSLFQIGEDLYLGNLSTDPVTDDEFLNHSCDPNVWIEDEATLVACRDIDAGEELTGDYGTWDANPAWKLAHECNCGSLLCRRVITGSDWQLPELQERYGQHFTPFLNGQIKKSHYAEAPSLDP